MGAICGGIDSEHDDIAYIRAGFSFEEKTCGRVSCRGMFQGTFLLSLLRGRSTRSITRAFFLPLPPSKAVRWTSKLLEELDGWPRKLSTARTRQDRAAI